MSRVSRLRLTDRCEDIATWSSLWRRFRRIVRVKVYFLTHSRKDEPANDVDVPVNEADVLVCDAEAASMATRPKRILRPLPDVGSLTSGVPTSIIGLTRLATSFAIMLIAGTIAASVQESINIPNDSYIYRRYEYIMTPGFGSVVLVVAGAATVAAAGFALSMFGVTAEERGH